MSTPVDRSSAISTSAIVSGSISWDRGRPDSRQATENENDRMEAHDESPSDDRDVAQNAHQRTGSVKNSDESVRDDARSQSEDRPSIPIKPKDGASPTVKRTEIEDIKAELLIVPDEMTKTEFKELWRVIFTVENYLNTLDIPAMHRAMKIFHVRVVNPTFLKCKTGANLKPTSATNHPGGHKFAQSAPSTTNPSRVDTIGLENRNKGVGQIPNAESKVHTIEKLGEKTSHNPDKKQAPASAAKQGPAPPMKQTPAPPVKQTPAPPMKLTPAPPVKQTPAPPEKQVQATATKQAHAPVIKSAQALNKNPGQAPQKHQGQNPDKDQVQNLAQRQNQHPDHERQNPDKKQSQILSRSSARKLDEKQSQNLGQKSSKILSEQSARKHEKAAAAKKTNLKRRSGDVDDYVKDANQDGEDQNSEEQRSEVEEQDIEEAYTTGAGGDNHYDGSITRSMPSGAPDLSLGTATGTLHAQAISSKQISTARVLAPSSKYSSVVSTSRRGHPEALVHAAIKNLKIMESTWHQTKLALEVITRILSREAVITLRDFLISVRSDMQIVQNMRSGEALSAPEDMPSVVEFQKFYTAVAEYQYIREDSSCIDLQQMRMLDRIAGTYIDLVQLIRTDESVFEKLRVSFEKYRKTVRGNTKGALSKHSPENTALTVLTSMQRPEGNRTNLAKDKKSLRNRIHQGANLRVLRKTFGDGAWAMLLEWAWRSRLQIVHHDTLAAAAHAIVTVEPNIKTIFQRLTYAIVLPLLRHQIPTHQLAFEQTTIHLLENDPGLMLTDLLGDGIEDYDMDQAADDEDDMDMMDESPYLMLGGTSTKQDAAMESHESIADEKDAGLDGPESIADTPYQRDPEDDD